MLHARERGRVFLVEILFSIDERERKIKNWLFPSSKIEI